MKRVLIAGAGSYIGQSFMRFVQENGLPVETDELDVQDSSWREADLSGYDSVVLVAGMAHQRETDENRHLYSEVNRDLAYEIAKTAKTAGIPHLVMLSTMSVYGKDEGVITPGTTPEPKSAYGMSKLEGERLVCALRDEDFRVAILRPPMVYGPGCKGNFNSLAHIALTSPVFPLVDNRRSMVFVDNLNAFITLCVARRLDGTFFPQDEEYMNTSHMARLVAEENGKKLLLSKVLGLSIVAMKAFASKARKAFGSLVYEGTELHAFSYCIVRQEEAVRQSASVLSTRNNTVAKSAHDNNSRLEVAIIDLGTGNQ